MYLNTKNLVVILFLSAAASASWYWSRAGTAINSPREFRDNSRLGYYLSNAEIVSTNEDGHPLYKIWANRAEERPNENRLFLSDVRVEYRPIEDVPWFLSAEFGEVPTDESYIDLRGAVELVNEPRGQGKRTLIQTQALRFVPENFVASSENSVSLFVGDGRLDAVGIRVYLRDDRLELESSVHGQFDP